MLYFFKKYRILYGSKSFVSSCIDFLKVSVLPLLKARDPACQSKHFAQTREVR